MLAVGIVLIVFVSSMTALTWFSNQALISKKLVDSQLECEKLARVLDSVWLKENFTQTFFLSQDANIYSTYIKVGEVYCLINARPSPVSLNPGLVTLTFSQGVLNVSN